MYKTRTGDLNDLAQLVTLFDRYRVFYGQPADPEGSAYFLSERMKNNESVIYVAENNELIIAGFVQLYPLFSSTQMKKMWLLNDLFVQPDFRGKGISVLLIEQAKELAMESGSCGLLLETAKTNKEGNGLYKKTSFQLSRESNYYYWDAEIDRSVQPNFGSTG